MFKWKTFFGLNPSRNVVHGFSVERKTPSSGLLCLSEADVEEIGR